MDAHVPGGIEYSERLGSGHSATAGDTIEAALREERIREAAYFLAERHGFKRGSELEDWLAAEREIDDLLTAEPPPPVGFTG